MKKTRAVTKLKTALIERAWAKYGTVFIEDKKGQQITLQPRVLAWRLRDWNENLSEEPSRRRQELEIIEMLSNVCREALHQKEDPQNTVTKAVTDAIGSKEAFDRVRCSPAMQKKIQEVQLKYPALAANEIVAVSRQGFPAQYEDDMFRTINEDRAKEWEDKIKSAKLASA